MPWACGQATPKADKRHSRMEYNEYIWEVYMNLWKIAVLSVSIIFCFGCAGTFEGRASESKGKVVICHKDKKTISVDEAAAKAHLGHGDYMGVCR